MFRAAAVRLSYRVVVAVCAAVMLSSAAIAGNDVQVFAGAYLVRAAGCLGCHTDPKTKDAPFSGGRALKTPFGTYYSPNITPHRDAGIGAWSDADFIRALRHGLSPAGQHYFPVFPYPTYSRMREADMLAIKAYLFSLPPDARANRAHDVGAPFGWRWTVAVWKGLFFEAGALAPDKNKSPAWNRGAYLVEALAHCGECHTPRNVLGALQAELHMAGTLDGPDGEIVPNITPDPDTGIADWNEADIVTLLKDGIKPDFDDVQGSMSEAIENGLKYLRQEDLQAIAVYLKSLPPIRNRVERKKP